MTEGKKFDEGKLDWYPMPLVVIKPLVQVFMVGVRKYGLFNCLKEFENSDQRFYNAQMRHAEACQMDPLAVDPEDGCYESAKVAWNALMRLYHAQKAQNKGEA